MINTFTVFLDDTPTEEVEFIQSNGNKAHWKPLKPIPGFRYFHCDECNRRFWYKTRDCYSPSNETCPECFADVHPYDSEEHPEWSVDKSGNLI